VPLVLGVMLVLAGCADEGSSTAGSTTPTAPTGPSVTATGPSAPTGPTGARSPTGTTGPTGATHTEAELEDGEHFGFVRSVDPDAKTMVFDLAYFLTGDEANAEAASRGLETPVPNDYFIVNDNPKLRTLALSPDLELALLDWNRCCDRFVEGDLAVFAAAVESGEIATIGDQIYYGSLSPYWLTVQDGAVTRIEEQYLP
jgi:hypothetical protein